MTTPGQQELVNLLRKAVADLEAAEGRAKAHCPQCGAARTAAVEDAKTMIVYFARAIYAPPLEP